MLKDYFWLFRLRLQTKIDIRFGPPKYLDKPIGQSSSWMTSHPASIPKIIWIYWAQGWHEAPPLVLDCLESWKRGNPGWEVRALDATLARDLINGEMFPFRAMSETHRANLVRLHLLSNYGGVWADATVFCERPLDEWLMQASTTGFFAFSRPGLDRLLSTWFLAAAPQHPLVVNWLRLAERYWRVVEKPSFYHWFHYLFADMCRSDSRLRNIWRATPRVSADPAHAVQWSTRGQFVPAAAAKALVHKLDWRLPYPAPQDETALATLIHRRVPTA
jgi:mannosyltransferase OCH1-like enzyme